MILVDRALERRAQEDRPVQVGIIGAGYMGRGIAAHLLGPPVPGMRLAAVYNRHLEQAERAYAEAGAGTPERVGSPAALDRAIGRAAHAVADDPFVVTDAEQIDVVVEATGEIEFGARVVLRALEQGKHVVLMNAELDATLGPILKVYADRAGVVITNTDGDEPGVAMNLVRFARTLGYTPVAAGNIKGMLDHYRTPETQRAFAEKYGQKPKHITSFADGTKLSMETTVLANGAGFGVVRRGMTGPACEHVAELLDKLPLHDALERGVVDYCVGAAPHTGAWVIGHTEHPVKRQYMDYFKMGKGPFYLFYTPYHLPHAQIVTTIARAALFDDATVAPVGAPQCEVLTLAKRDLKAGETLDGIGGFMSYGWIDNAEVQRRERLLPMGLSEGCVLTRDVAKDEAIGYGDVTVPEGRVCDELRGEQEGRLPAG
jgi:predicted homoserine dehydrogenase-like protein